MVTNEHNQTDETNVDLSIPKNTLSVNSQAISNLVNSATLISTMTSLQNSIKLANMSSIASSAIATSLDVKEYFPTKSYFDPSMIKSITASMPKVKLDVNDEYLASMSFLYDVVRDLSARINLNYSKFFSDIAEILKKLKTDYSQEEIDEIIIDVREFSKSGWVIYFDEIDIYERLKAYEVSNLVEEWIAKLEYILTEEVELQEIYKVGCYPTPLLNSMLACYESENYYAAYSLATLAIDGALTRFSEILSDKPRIPVGTGAVKDLDKSLLVKSITDLGFFEWLYQFFKDTERFTLGEPNRHMIGHGRWAGEISKSDFLQLFNVMLYFCAKFDKWQTVVSKG